jgi:NADPH-dependent ferric siderophore reductase
VPTVERVRHDLRRRVLEVRRIDDLTPSMRRITLAGDDLDSFVSAGADDHVKLFFPPDGDTPPSFGDGNGERSPSRDFTPRRFDTEAGELVVDFVLHGDGPAASWAAAAQPGWLIGQGGPRGSFVVSPDFDWYVLAGDETALPAIGRRLDELPPDTHVIVLAEVAGPNDEIELRAGPDTTVRWLHRGDAQAGASTALEDAVRALELPGGDGFAWVACEATIARRLRDHLREERGLPASWTRVTGYWTRGVADAGH